MILEKLMKFASKKWLYKGGDSYHENVFYHENVNKKYFEREIKYYQKYENSRKEILYKFKKRYKVLWWFEIALKLAIFTPFFLPGLIKTWLKKPKNKKYKKIK